MLEPFQTERIDIAGALVASVISNVNRGKNDKPLGLEAFMVVQNMIKSHADQQVTEEQREAIHLKSFILSMGGRLQ